ncbi:hypothetical protein FIBSPDRAFT_902697 [Athelia psychrophila]|uniref:Uncharacterized protein n=1 Tax=Athelia psychrophila TaxID=1759441 RepID=A0A167WWZ2_9AGAM|nr:hypothetical protein FIBSPDRAFT_902697 [Fibularhizoctonia sp. CBS 109695]
MEDRIMLLLPVKVRSSEPTGKGITDLRRIRGQELPRSKFLNHANARSNACNAAYTSRAGKRNEEDAVNSQRQRSSPYIQSPRSIYGDAIVKICEATGILEQSPYSDPLGMKWSYIGRRFRTLQEPSHYRACTASGRAEQYLAFSSGKLLQLSGYTTGYGNRSLFVNQTVNGATKKQIMTDYMKHRLPRTVAVHERWRSRELNNDVRTEHVRVQYKKAQLAYR